jgi:hypothetical protein
MKYRYFTVESTVDVCQRGKLSVHGELNWGVPHIQKVLLNAFLYKNSLFFILMIFIT